MCICRYYEDGELQADVTAGSALPGSTGGTDLLIGKPHLDLNEHKQGVFQMADLRIRNSPISASKLKEYFTGKKSVHCSFGYRK